MPRKVTKSYLFLVVLFFLTNVILGQDSTKITKDDNSKVDAKEHGQKFVDIDGDGYNDNAPDHDGDGIPNGLDEDYVKLKKGQLPEYIDLDGDGINDNQLIKRNTRHQMYHYKGGDLNLKPQDGSNKDNEGPNGKTKGKGSGNGRGGG